MKHVIIIQSEFLKQARDWDELSIYEQKEYLKRHPESKRRLTAKFDKRKKMSIYDKLEKAREKERAKYIEMYGIKNGISVEKAQEIAKKQAGMLVPEEIKSIQEYARFMYEYINKDLRRFKGDFETREIKNIDSAFSKIDPVDESFEVKRRVNSISYIPKKGEVFVEPAYTSTYFSDDAKLNVNSGNLREEPITIKIPSGSKVIFIQNELAPPNLSFRGEKIGVLNGEREALLPRGSKFKVIQRRNGVVLELINEKE